LYIELEELNDQLELVQTGIERTVDEIKMAEDQQKMAEHKKKQAETVKDNYEKRSLQIRLSIDQTEALRAKKNQYWLDLINESLRQHKMHHHHR
jgi:uncharacterized protein (DUF4415 family)